VIVGDLPRVRYRREVIDDIVIEAEGKAIDGKGRVLGQAGPTVFRPRTRAKTSLLPAMGMMQFDSADLKEMERLGTLNDVITHEMGHVLGIGTVWEDKGLLKGAGGSNPTFAGPKAMKEYKVLRNATGQAKRVPVENQGGVGTADSHWRETIFRNELMSGWVESAGNPLSRMTVASLADIGYTVDLDAAEPYALADLMSIAEAGPMITHIAPIDVGIVLPTIPLELPASSLE
jgi:Leishmanolysin